jgi:hypothetical protein
MKLICLLFLTFSLSIQEYFNEEDETPIQTSVEDENKNELTK